MTTILVVDNSHFLNIELIRSTFVPFGYEIIAAQNIQDGLSLARTKSPDLILSDLHIPGGDGFDFICAVKVDAALKSTPFLFIFSTVWDNKDQIEGLLLGAERFIIPPIETQELLREVGTFLKG